MTVAFFIVHLFEFPSRWCTSVPHYLVVKWLVSCEIAAISVHVLCTPYNHAPVYSVTTKGACVFSCILPPALSAEWLGSFICFWGNTGVEGYQNKSQHRKLTLEKKILLLLCQDSNPWPFITSLVLNHWAIPAPQVLCGKRVDCVIKRREERLFFLKSLKVVGLAKLIMYYEKFELKSFSFLAYPKVSFVPCNGLSLVRWVTGGHKIESTALSWSHC